MKFDLPLFGKKKDPKYWEAKLDVARAGLWDQDRERARNLYLEVSQTLKQLKQKTNKSIFDALYAEASAGLWAVNYLNGNSESSECQKYLVMFPENPRILVLLVNVLGSQWDTSLEALEIYQKLISTFPSEKNARSIWSIVRRAQHTDRALEILEQVAEILKDDIDIWSLLTKWAFKGRKYSLAASYAKQMIQKQPDHVEAHRCLGVIAELEEEWEKAAKHYQASDDRIRQAVVLNHCGKHKKALSVLRKVPEAEQIDATWLYHAGWCMFKIGDIHRAVGFWKQLRNRFPGHSKEIDHGIGEIQTDTIYSLLENEKELELRRIPPGPEPYYSEAILRRTLIEFLLNRDNKSAAKVLNDIGPKIPDDEKIYCLNQAVIAASSDDSHVDQKNVEYFTHRFGSANLYLLLRCLWLAPTEPARASTLIEEIDLQKDVINREGTLLAKWLIKQLLLLKKESEGNRNTAVGKTYDIPIDLAIADHFTQAIINTYAASMIFDSKIDELKRVEQLLLLKKSKDPVSAQILALSYVKKSAWLQALILLQDAPSQELEDKVIKAGIRDYLLAKDWYHLSCLAMETLKEKPDNLGYQKLASVLHPYIFEYAWKNTQINNLEHYFSQFVEEQPGNIERHHELAIIYTRRAIANDAGIPADCSLDLWELAIGHWAVTLTSSEYWKKWAQERYEFYKSGTISQDETKQLRNEGIPGLLKNYFQEKEEDLPPNKANRYRLYHALVNQEINNVIAVRQLIELANQSSYDLPGELYSWISPSLIRQHGLSFINTDIYKAMKELSISRSAQFVIEESLSGLYKVQAFVNSKHYELALAELQELEQVWTTLSGIEWIRFEKIEILKAYTRQLIEDQNWEQALKVARTAYDQFPSNHNLDENYQEALTGWANWMYQKGESKQVINEVDKLLQTHDELPTELWLLYIEAMLNEGKKAFQAGRWKLAIKIFKEVLAWDPDHEKAKNGLALVYMQLASEAEENNDFKLAYKNAKIMYEYVQDQTTATVYASACAKYAIFLADGEHYSNAINVLEPALTLPYDREEFQLEELLSTILTNYGAVLYNSGSTQKGYQIMKRALALDPTNPVARRNLRISGGIY